MSLGGAEAEHGLYFPAAVLLAISCDPVSRSD